MFSLLLVAIATILSVYFYLVRNYDYWRVRGVPGPKPRLIFGNTIDATLLRTTVSESIQKIYRMYEGLDYVGIYELGSPALMIRDPKLVKLIFVKDFHHFQGRGIPVNESADPLSANLINLSGPRWRVLRTKLSPAFTIVKIRQMFPLIAKSSVKYKEFLKKYADNEEIVEFRDLAAKFTTEVIGTCCFGLETNSIQDEDSEFRSMCRKVLDPSMVTGLKRIVRGYLPDIFEYFGMSLTPHQVYQYFMGMVRDIIKFREANNYSRHDIMQLLMQLKKDDDKVRHEQEDIKSNADVSDLAVIDDNAILATAYIFFLAGFETSSTTMGFVTYELASNPDIQEKLHTEIKTILQKHNGDITYEAISEMEYLDRVIRETLRKHPPVGMIPRVCNKAYQIPGTDLTIEQGIKVVVPVYAIHHDPQYYPEPWKFDPDRFLEDNKMLRENCTFLPFGEGPRICIGTRFAYTQTKAGLVALLSDYKVELSKRSQVPLEYDPTASILALKSGVWLKIRHRNDK